MIMASSTTLSNKNNDVHTSNKAPSIRSKDTTSNTLKNIGVINVGKQNHHSMKYMAKNHR